MNNWGSFEGMLENCRAWIENHKRNRRKISIKRFEQWAIKSSCVGSRFIFVSTSPCPFNSFSKFYCKFTCFLDASYHFRCCFMFILHSFIVMFQLFMIHWHASSFLCRNFHVFYPSFSPRLTTSGLTATCQRQLPGSVLTFYMKTLRKMLCKPCRWDWIVTFLCSWS